MLKVYIQDRCPYCDGQAYLPAGQATDWKGETYTRYAPCQMCEGTGERGKPPYRLVNSPLGETYHRIGQVELDTFRGSLHRLVISRGKKVDGELKWG